MHTNGGIKKREIWREIRGLSRAHFRGCKIWRSVDHWGSCSAWGNRWREDTLPRSLHWRGSWGTGAPWEKVCVPLCACVCVCVTCWFLQSQSQMPALTRRRLCAAEGNCCWQGLANFHSHLESDFHPQFCRRHLLHKEKFTFSEPGIFSLAHWA